MEYQLEVLLMFSSMGLLYIGYTSKTKIQGIVLGTIGTIPLFLFMILFERIGAINGEGFEIWILISFLAIGAFCGGIGSYLAKSRKKVIKQKLAMKKDKSRKKPPKALRNRKH